MSYIRTHVPAKLEEQVWIIVEWLLENSSCFLSLASEVVVSMVEMVLVVATSLLYTASRRDFNFCVR